MAEKAEAIKNETAPQQPEPNAGEAGVSLLRLIMRPLPNFTMLSAGRFNFCWTAGASRPPNSEAVAES
jgi:hypothetical protein